MDTESFLSRILSDSGYYCLFVAKQKKVKQYFFDSINKLTTAAEQLDGKGVDTYFAVGTFHGTQTRKVDNIHQLQSFFLDIDCGKGKPYLTQKDGNNALKKFCQTTGLPFPICVNSGGGLHAYWPLVEPLTADQWIPRAEKLKKLCADKGFEADPAVTADAARILRVPGTHNYKENQPRLTKILGNELAPAVDVSVIDDSIANMAITSPKLVDAKQRLLEQERAKRYEGRICKFQTIAKKTLKGKGCPQIAYILKHRATLEEPMWRAGLSIAHFCQDGEKSAQLLSVGYPDYDPAATAKKMEETKGPYTCETFDSLNPGVCESCPHNNRKFESPIALGVELEHATEEDNRVPVKPKFDTPSDNTLQPEDVSFESIVVDIPSYPKGYFRAKTGGVYVETIDNEGEKIQVPVYANDLYVIKRIRDPEEGESLVVRLHLPVDGMQEFTIPLTCVGGSGDELRKRLSKEGVVTNNWKAMSQYIMDWTNKLQSEVLAEDARTQFGWDKDRRTFAAGNNLIHEGGKVTTNHPSARTSPYFKFFDRRGTLDGWKEAMRFFNQAGMDAHQFVICTAFGAPLIEFVPNIQAAAMHIYSGDTGLGKTTAMWAAASIWGNYTELCGKAGDTANFTLHRAEIWKNLPLYVDELTNATPEVLSDYILSISQGKQRGRLEGSANKERFRGDPWGLLAVSTGNTSISEKISVMKAEARAEAARMLEIHVNEFVTREHDTLDTRAFNEQLEGNYGHAGILFMMAFQREKEYAIKLLRQVEMKVESLCGINYKNRFWLAYIACAVTGGILAKKWGLIDFDMDNLLNKFVKRLVRHNKGILNAAQLTPEELVNLYISEHYNDTLIIESTEANVSITPKQGPKRNLFIRYEPDTKKLALLSSPFKKWCVSDKRVNFEELKAVLKAKYNLDSKTVRLTKGTDLSNLPPAWCLVVDAAEFVNVNDADSS
jgi:hypothetical protein